MHMSYMLLHTPLLPSLSARTYSLRLTCPKFARCGPTGASLAPVGPHHDEPFFEPLASPAPVLKRGLTSKVRALASPDPP